MNTEQKAKAYDEALKAAIAAHKDEDRHLKATLERIFPELKESKDERVRKEIIAFIKKRDRSGCDYDYDQWIAWLEKQEGCEYIKKDWLEHIKQSWYKEGFIDGKYSGGTSKEWTINDAAIFKEIIDFLENGTAKLQHDLTKYANWLKIQFTPIEKQGEQKSIDNLTQQEAMDIAVAKCFNEGEQKPANKVEPKFHEREWITNGDYTWKIVEVKPLDYILQSQEGNIVDDTISHVDEQFHSFTIKDAKDGDVLDANGAPFIYKKHDKNYVYYYCGVNLGGEFTVAHGIDAWNSKYKVYPATKEQRDTLFAKMKEAGYEWNADKKELKKIEQKPTNENPTDVGHEYYSELLNNDDSDTIDEYAYQCAYCMSHDWMKETATWEDVQKAVKLGAEWQKQNPAECSEEDEDAIEMAIIALEDMYDEDAPNTTYGGYNLPFNKAAERLKSIKDRVQPKPMQEWKQENIEELTEFENAMMHIGGSFFGENAGLDPNDTDTIKEQAELLLELAPKQEWSEEDETKMRAALAFIKSEFPKKGDEEIMEDTIEWLKSLRPQNKWKPSKGQLECLGYAIDKAEKDYSPLANNRIYLTLKALKEELEKLTE